MGTAYPERKCRESGQNCDCRRHSATIRTPVGLQGSSNVQLAASVLYNLSSNVANKAAFKYSCYNPPMLGRRFLCRSSLRVPCSRSRLSLSAQFRD